MTKFLIYIVAFAILVLLGVDAFLVATGKGTPNTIVELAVGGGAILAFAIASFVKTIGGFSWPTWHRKRKTTIADVEDKVSAVDSKVDDIDSKVDSVDSKVDDINSTLNDRLGPEPDGFVAVINTTDENGKIVKLYDLPVSNTYDDAIQDAKDSLQARAEEGNPVTEAKITVVPVYGL